MTAVASPPSFQPPHTRSGWSSNGLNSMQDDVSAMFGAPRKSAQRSNSSSSLSSNSSDSSSDTAVSGSINGSGNTSVTLTPITDLGSQGARGGAFPGQEQSGNTVHRKKPARPREANGPWLIGKAEASAGVTSVRPQSVLATNGVGAANSMSNIQQQQHSVLPSQGQQQTTTQQQNSIRGGAPPAEATPALYLLSQNGTFDAKRISVPYYPDNLRIGRQTNAKTVPTPTNGYFDSKVLSRQHAEIWSDRNGKIWIRDVRSSNGTFVNGSRLSAENRDSEPHELQTGDHLELGIDIVSEDQKTVVHHKVAAKVEHAGFLGPGGVPGNNVLDMGFGDLDPSNGQNGLLRGRTNTQGLLPGQQQRPGQQMLMGGMAAGQQMPRNFWLTPITTEAIVKRLTHEMRQARLQSTDLAETEDFLSTILHSKDFAPSPSQPLQASDSQNSQDSNSKAFAPMANGQPQKMDPIVVSRFSDPPAPPPQQPLPEKPDGPRLNTGESVLKRANTARPGSQSGSPIKSAGPENPGQIVSLLEALKTAKKEIESQSDKMKELEEQLLKERQARLEAEEMAKRLESSNFEVLTNGTGEDEVEDTSDTATLSDAQHAEEEAAQDDKSMADEVETSAKALQEKLEIMMSEMSEMKQLMESYRQRAENAEQERDDTRKTLAEMVQKIRSDEEARIFKKALKAERRSSEELLKNAAKEAEKLEAKINTAYNTAAEDNVVTPVKNMANGAVATASSLVTKAQDQGLAVARQSGSQLELVDASNTAPYASMVGVVLIGLGIMTYLNGGWQKVDRS